ncbi:hypothetical protein F2P56_011293 [Juglans regia]|uniref:AAA+ ATPase domain-containing protein n=2 Tax=Juglans regia TaxID=51240 RepID=A0A833XS65_JUGRE|nr:probable disease resistance protein At4g27220 [Juglans regia]KAF5470804.1 hypothetical protein F2P56_011293 [Juglans regia]
MEKLKEHLQKLRDRRVAVEQSINAAELNQQVTSHEVKSWLTKVEKIISALENDKTNRKCLNGWCPNPKARYSSSRKAKNKAQDIGELLQEGRNYGGVYIDAPPPETGSSSSTEDVKHFKSRTSILNEVLIALRDDKINIIAICGMAGVGKTEMAKEIGRRAKVDHLFDKVVIAEVSQSPNLRVIQSEIAENLGLKFYQESLAGRANALNSIITKTKNVLVILDDIWEPLDLVKVGIPYGDKHKSCKILITSRSEETCNQMKTQIIFPIKPLSEVDAWNLFKRTAGDCIQNGGPFQIAKDVLKECGGLPVAIVIIGNALANKSKEEWTAVLQQLRRSGLENIPVYSKVYSSIKSSYDYLESKEARSCFLLCCLFPEDHNIPIEDLVRYGVGRNLFANIDTIEEARREVHQMVRNLRRSNLLLDGEDEEHVKMHVVVRDVAISIASKDEHCFLVRCDYKMEEWPQNERYEHYAAISLVSKELERHLDGLECPKLELLHMSLSLERPQTFPTNLFSGMKELKILSLHCISSLSLPLSIRVLQNLRVLKLENCSLKDVSAIESLLKLKILSFRGSYIKELPREIQNLSWLKLLDLSECWDLQRIPPGVFSSLSRLEELYMEQSFPCWESPEENGNKINADLFSSQHMMVLDICIPIRLLQKGLYLRNFRIYASERLDRLFELYIKSSMHWKSRYLFENTLALECKASDIAKSPRILLMLQKAEILCLIEIRDLKNNLFELGFQSFPRLKFLEVSKCNMRYLIDVKSDQTRPHAAFPLLESLVLRWTDKLVKICHDRDVLGNLRYLNLYGCTSLKNAFPLSIARDLIQLQRLIIEHCYAMEEIFSGEEKDKKEVPKMIVFPKLYHVELNFLTSLIAFCKGNDPVSEVLESSNVDAQKPSSNQEIENILEVGEEEDAVEIIVFPKFWSFKWPSMHEIYLYECPNLITFGPEIGSTAKPKKINVGLDSKRQDHTGTTSSVKNAPGFLDRCLDCVLCRKKLQGSSSLGGNEPEFQGQILHPPVNKEVDPNGNDRDIQTEIRSLIPSSLINSMQNLQLLEAVKCNSLEAIFELEGLNLEKSSAFIACNNLRELKLRTLPKLKHIWKDGPQEITGFHELRLLVVSECHNLKYLFSPSIAKLLVELEEIEVQECNEMEAILAKARENEKSEVTFPNVHTLSLVRLRKLECFCVEANAFKWPSLTKVKVVGCDKLKMFVPRKVETPPELVRVNTDLRELKFQYMVGDLNDAIREMMIKCEGRSLQSRPADWVTIVTFCHLQGIQS